MVLRQLFFLLSAAILSFSSIGGASPAASAKSPEQLRKEAYHLLDDTNEYKKAAHSYVQLLKTVDDEKSGEDMIRLIKSCKEIEKTLPPEEVLDTSLMPKFPDEGQDANQAIESSGSPSKKTAAKESFIDLNALINTYMPRHKDNPHFIMAVADFFYADAWHNVHVKQGVSFRPLNGYRNNYGAICESSDMADLKKALVLYKNLLDKHQNDSELKKDKKLLIQIMEGFITALQHKLAWNSSSGLPRKTDIDTNALPDEKKEFSRAPNILADNEDKPILPSLPSSWASAKSDLERSLFLYEQALALTPENKQQEIRLNRAEFLSSIFSLSALIRSSYFGDDRAATIAILKQRSSFADNQTIILINDKPLIITLPEHLDYIKELKTIADLPADIETKYHICFALAAELTSRDQLKEALKWIEQAEKFAKGDEDRDLKVSKAKDQITQPSAMLLPNEAPYIPHAGGKPLSIGMLYRNMDSVRISLQRIDVEAIAQDYPEKDKDGLPQWEASAINDILRHAFSPKNENKPSKNYLSKAPITVTRQIPSTPDHTDRFAELNLPEASPGLYLLQVKISDKKSLYRIINISNLALASRPCPQGIMWIAADAATGFPVQGAEIKGTFIDANYKAESSSDDPFSNSDSSEPTDSGKKKLRFIPFSGKTNADGIMIVSVPGKIREIKSSCMAQYKQSFAMYGWMENQYIDYSNFEHIEKNHIDLLFQTSQPVYKPGQTVRAQCRMVAANYLKASLSTLANKTWEIKVQDPMGNQIDIGKKSVRTDATGAFPFEYTLPEHAKLGWYHVIVRPQNAGKREYGYTTGFYVEEYKKPEFEVSVTPQSEVVQLGDPVQFSIRATYYAGGPVAGGKATVSVTRNPLLSSWKPSWKWNWLSELVIPSRHHYSRPTTVMESHQVILDEQGKAVITLPTEQDKKDFEKTAQEYSIDVSVTDASLREVTASGSILAPVLPFEAFAELDSNYVRPGENIPVSLFARTIQGKPVPGVTGTASLYRISLDKKTIVETKISSAPVSMDDEGNGSLVTQVDKPGSYKLAFDFKNAQGQKSSISREFMSYGTASNTDTPPFPSPHVKLTPEKKAYAPGETAQILVTSSSPNAFIWAFLRSGWKNETLKTLSLKDQSGVLPVETSRADMPNFGISAFAVFNGQIFSDKTSILLPPEDKSLNLHASSNEASYQPGQEGTLAVQIKTAEGKPAPANTQVTLTIYDKALSYFSQPDSPLIRQVWGFSNREEDPPPHIQRYDIGKDDNDLFLSSIYDGEPEGFISTNCLSLYLGEDSYSSEAPDWTWCLISSRFDINDTEQEDPFAFAGNVDPFCEGAAALASVDKAWGTPVLAQGTNSSPDIRSNFVDSIKWCGTLITDEKGQIHVPFKTSDDLTTWQAKAWAISPDLSVGEATAEFICAKDLMISLQTPRFLVGGDTVTISAVVRNQTESSIESAVTLKPEGCAQFGKESNPETQQVSVPAKGQITVNWTIKAEGSGTAEFTVEAKGSKSDAMKLSIPVLIHGMKQIHAFNSVMLPGQKESKFDVKLPADIRRNDTVLNISLSPSVALAMVDSLPYLSDYPHGCAEQTLNKFLPALIVRKTMKDYGIDLAKLGTGTLGTPQEASALQQVNKKRKHNPVFDSRKFDTIVRNNLSRLLDMQMASGAWGWFGGLRANADPMITATVYRGLTLAQQAGTDIPKNVLDQAKKWLIDYENKQVALLKHGDEREKMTAEQKDNDRKDYRTKPNELDAKIRLALQQSGIANDAMTAYLKRDVNELSIYGQLLFAQALATVNANDSAAADILRKLDQYLSIDESLQTAHLNLSNQGFWWFWYGDNVSTQAAYLDLLCTIDPKSPNMARFAKWLVLNRTNGAYWNSTLDTANAVHALSRYLSITKEGMEPMEAEIYYGDRLAGTIKTDKSTLLTANREITLKGEEACAPAVDGKIPVTIKRIKGEGNIYIDATLSAFTLQDPLPATGNALRISRTYYLIGKKTKEATGQSDKGTLITRPVTEETRTPLPENATVDSGDTIEVELAITLKNDVEYLLLSDPKPAGCESKSITSGYDYCGNVFAYREAGAESTRFFISSLKEGSHTITFRLRAERPGKFSALPTVIEAMYAPTLRGNSREDKMDIIHEPSSK